MIGFLRPPHFADHLCRLGAVLLYLCISFLIPNSGSAAEKMKFKLASGGNSVICGRVCGRAT
jgi:hypothetical protein